MCVHGIAISAMARVKRIAWSTVGLNRRPQLRRGRIEHGFLFTTDGFEMYERAAKRLLKGVCIYGQVIKRRRENRVVRVDRRLLLGTPAELEDALFHSEDSSTLNTSFIERHNLTISQGCSNLRRRTPCHTRRTEFLEGQVALLMAYYNFRRPHTALKFGATVRTPAMQAGLAKKKLSFRDVFTTQAIRLQATVECRWNSTTLD